MSGQPHFEIYRDKRGEWRWRFRAANGKCIAVSSEGYKRWNDAVAAVDLVRDTDRDTLSEVI